MKPIHVVVIMLLGMATTASFIVASTHERSDDVTVETTSVAGIFLLVGLMFAILVAAN